MRHIIETFIPITLFLCAAATVIVIRKFVSDERLALIDKNLSAKLFKAESNTRITLRYGLLLFGSGLGMLIGSILSNQGLIEPKAIAIFSCIFIFGGIGLFTSYFVESAIEKKNRPTDKEIN